MRLRMSELFDRAQAYRAAPWPLYAVSMQVANVTGAVFVFSFLRFFIPGPDAVFLLSDMRVLNQALFVAYLAFTVISGSILGLIVIRPVVEWQHAGAVQPLPEKVRERALRIPSTNAKIHAGFWTIGGIIFVTANLHQSGKFALVIAVTVVFGASSACAVGYFLSERVLRPIHIAALAAGGPIYRHPPNSATRLNLAWVLSTLLPVSGIILVVLADQADALTASPGAVLNSVLLLGVGAIAAGYFMMRLTSSAVTDPIDQLRHALKRVQEGDLTTTVRIYDGSDLGMLQSGFNEMVRDLAEREQLRDIFGKYVGEDVARRALREGVALGGEERSVAVLFVDLTGSTTIAMQVPPAEVVALLNQFFREVVEVVGRHGGFVNKFLGDAALAIFGAPIEVDDPAGSALAAARELRVMLDATLTEVSAGIGVSSGNVIAGHIGAAERFEYTVIGDPVNEAARLTELAKKEPTGVLASFSTVQQANPEEGAHWVALRNVELRGRGVPTEVAAPHSLPSVG